MIDSHISSGPFPEHKTPPREAATAFLHLSTSIMRIGSLYPAKRHTPTLRMNRSDTPYASLKPREPNPVRGRPTLFVILSVDTAESASNGVFIAMSVVPGHVTLIHVVVTHHRIFRVFLELHLFAG